MDKAGGAMIDIWNAALMEIGCRIVAAPDEHTAEAMICAQFYSRARLETLRSFPWSFAAVRWQLSPKPMPEAWRGAWKYAYAYPPACAAVRNVSNGSGTGRGCYAIRMNHGEKLILCDMENALADMTEDVRDPEIWDEGFKAALVLRLAMLILVPLLKSSARMGEISQRYEAAIRKAREADAMEEPPISVRDAWLECYEGEA